MTVSGSNAGRTTRVAAVLLMVALGTAACGLRTPVRPPEDTAPVIPGEVTMQQKDGETLVRWKRADHSVDGLPLYDLGTFLIERKLAGEDLWQQAAIIDVIDQEKIRRRRDFSWRDSAAGHATASYRVSAVCADGEQGPANQAVLRTENTDEAPMELGTPTEAHVGDEIPDEALPNVQVDDAENDARNRALGDPQGVGDALDGVVPNAADAGDDANVGEPSE